MGITGGCGVAIATTSCPELAFLRPTPVEVNGRWAAIQYAGSYSLFQC